jgi:hypothetical protein
MTIAEVQSEVTEAWANSYSPEANRRAIDSISDQPVPYKISHLIARLFFRGIYFPRGGAWGWLKAIAQNRSTIFRIIRDCFTRWHGAAPGRESLEFETGTPRVTPALGAPPISESSQGD